MRVATSSLQLQWLADVYRQQNDIASLQQEVATGKKINTAADDPAGAAASVNLQQSIDRLTNYSANSDTATRRLSLSANTLSQVQDVLTRVRELAVQAGGGDQTPQTRSAIATEANQLLGNLISLGNSSDGQGHYLFSGNQVATQPFTQGPTGVTYNGDSGARSQRIGDTRTIQESDPGSAVFMDIPSGNGTFNVAANASNQGSAFYSAATVTNPAAWVPGTYALSFTGPTTYAVTDSSGTTVASGSWTAGQSIAFNGISVTVQGAPVTGDSFAITPSTKQDIFKTIGNFLTNLQSTDSSPAGKANFQSSLNTTLAELDQVDNHISLAESQVGGRLAAITAQTSVNTSLSDQLQTSLSSIRDADYPAAISELQQKLTGLNAAYQAYAKTQSSTLFSVL